MEQPVVLVEGDSFIRWLHSYIRYKTKETCGCHVMFYGTPAATLRRFVLCVRRLPVDVLLRRFYYPVHMTNCFSYYRFLLSCIIGIIVGGALNTHVELELAKQVKMAISKRYYNGTLSVKCYCITVTCTVQCLCVCYH